MVGRELYYTVVVLVLSQRIESEEGEAMA